MQNTRQRILDFLNNNYQATALEMSQVFQMTPANIRHHLTILEKDNQIEIVGQSKMDGRGRPNLIYMPTKKVLGNGLVNLTTALLKTINDSGSKKQKEKKIQNLSKNLIGDGLQKNQPITLRLGFAVQRLNELAYKSHWEAHIDSPRIFLGNCPYSELTDEHTDLCKMDNYLIEGLVDNKVEMIEKCSRKPGESNHCVFKLIS